MLRTDGLLLAYLVARARPGARRVVREILGSLGPQAGSAAVLGQALIRHKVLGPRDFIALQTQLERSRRRCKSCRREFIAVAGSSPKKRRCRCGKLNRIPAVTLPEGEQPQVTSSRRARQEDPRRSDPRGGSKRRHKVAAHEAGGGSEESASRRPRRIGRYHVLSRIGGGGMGLIFKAFDPKRERTVALKLLRSDASKEVRVRFKREAEALSRLDHPNVVKVYGVGQDGGQLYFTMEFVAGKDLFELRGKIPRDRYLLMMAEVAEGLQHVHEHGIVHRDIKPHNVIVNADGQPKLADFGLAKDLARSSLTEVGDLIGTPLYMAPEQLRGDRTLIDSRTDIFALGVMLYEGLVGRLPIEAKSFVDLQRKLEKEPPTPPSERIGGVAPELDQIVLKALEKDPGDRYQTAQGLAADLRRFLRGRSVDALREDDPARRAGFLESPLGIAVLVLCLLGVGGAIAFAYQQRTTVVDDGRAARREQLKRELSEQAQALQDVLEQARRYVEQGPQSAALPKARAGLELAEALLERTQQAGDDAPGGALPTAEAARDEARALLARALAGGPPEGHPEALELLAAALAQNPQEPTLRVLDGSLRLRRGELGKARVSLEAATEAAPDQADAWFYLGEVERLQSRHEPALSAYSRALEHAATLGRIPPAELQAKRTLPLVALGRGERAYRVLGKAKTADPDNPWTRLADAVLAIDQGGDLPAGLRTQVRLADARPDLSELRLWAGRSWGRVGHEERARRELRQGLARLPIPAFALDLARLLARDASGDQELATILARTRADSPPGELDALQGRLIEGRWQRSRGQLQKALQALDTADLSDAQREAQPALVARLRLERAEVALSCDLELAARLFRDTERDHQLPRSLRLQLQLDRIELALAREEAARARGLLAELLRDGALTGSPRACELRLRLAAAEEERERLRGTAALAERAFLTQSDWSDVSPLQPDLEALSYLNRGRRLLRRIQRELTPTREIPRARELLRRALNLAPWLTTARAALASAQAAAGEPLVALATLEAGQARGRLGADGWTLKGRLLAGLGEHGQAVEAYGTAVACLGQLGQELGARRLAHAQSELFLLRARSVRALGNAQEALLDLDAAIVLVPDDPTPYRERLPLLEERGEHELAAADRRRLELLESGYRALGQQALTEPHALQTLTRALEATPARLVPAWAAKLYLARAKVRFDGLDLAAGLGDLAVAIELDSNRLEDLPGALRGLTKGNLDLDVERLLAQVDQEPVPSGVDEDLLTGLKASVAAELGRRLNPERYQRGVAALERFLIDRPGHPAALLLLAGLEGRAAADRLPRAIRAATACLELPDPPPFAHYTLGRQLLALGDPEAALRSLEQAVEAGFRTLGVMRDDPALVALGRDPRLQALIERGQALRDLDRLHELEEGAAGGQSPEEREELALRAATLALKGIRTLGRAVAAEDGPARRLQARLYLARARQALRVRADPDLARDLAAGLERSPEVLLQQDTVQELIRAARERSLGRASFDVRPRQGEDVPSAFARSVPDLLTILRTGELAPELREDLFARLDDLERPGPLRAPWRALVALAAGELETASQRLAEFAGQPELAGVQALLQARLALANQRPDEALTQLEQALELGLRGPLADDPVWAPLRDDPRFAAIAAAARARSDLRTRRAWARAGGWDEPE